MNGRKRKIQVKFYVTEEERKLIEEKMKLVPINNMAAYLRKIAIDGYIIQVDHTDIKAMTAEIQKIGVNVNQIARRVNATGNAYKEDSVDFSLPPRKRVVSQFPIIVSALSLYMAFSWLCDCRMMEADAGVLWSLGFLYSQGIGAYQGYFLQK